MKIKRRLRTILIIGAGKGMRYLIAPTISIAIVIFPVIMVVQPIIKEGNLPKACLQNS